MEGADENYNFKSTSSISTNYNSRPRSTYLNQRKAGRLIKTQQSRSVSPNTFQPLYLEHKSANSKNIYLLKKRDLSNQQLKDVVEVNQSIELKNSISSQKEKQYQKRPFSTNQSTRIVQAQNINDGINPKQNNLLGNDLNNQSKDVLSTNNSYYNQFYNVSKILNQTDNNLDISSFLDVTNNSVKNGQSLNKTQGSASTNNYFNNLGSESNDISQFNSNQNIQNKSRILTENIQNDNRELRSLSRLGQRNAKSNNKTNRKIMISNSKNQINNQDNNILIQEEDKMRDSQQSFYEDDNRNKREVKTEKKEEKENKGDDDNVIHIKKEYMDEKEVKNISYYINNMMYEDFKVYTDAQLLSKMDRESLIIRVQLLEQENKEIKCHNLHLSSKFKDMLNEYARYKEYQDNIDRKSLYQKHVQKLAELSKTCHDQAETIQQKNQKIQQLEEVIVKKESKIKELLQEIAQYDELKELEIKEVDNKYKQQIEDYQERVDYLNKENRKIPLLEKTYKDLVDKMNEDKTKYLNALDKSEERYKSLSNKLTEKDREIWNLKEKIKETELQIKFMQEQNQVAVQEKCNEYERKLSRLEVEQHAINLNYQKQEKQFITEIKQLQEQSSDLRKKILENEQKALEKEQSLGNVIQSQNEEYQAYKVETINQVADILSRNENLETVLGEKKQIIEAKQKEIQQKTTKIIELQKKLESVIASKEKMKEEHERELNKIFKTKQDETQSLTFKIKEMKLYYEVEIENLKKECDEKIKEHSSSATDAKRQYFAMKNNFNQDIEFKENEIEFLKNKIYEEKQKIKDQIDNQYKDMIKDMQKRIQFLQTELDEQKFEVENTICEDLAVYNRQSKYWKKSREIREEKYSIKSINSEESSKKMSDVTPLKKRQTISQKPSQNQQLTQQDILRLKFQVIAKCAVAFEDQQNKIDKLRAQIDVLSKKANTLLKQQLINGGVVGKGTVGTSDNNLDQNCMQISNSNQIYRQNALLVDNMISNENDLFLDENDLKDLELAKQVKQLREQLYQQKLQNQEIQNQFIQREYELIESQKQEKKNLQKQFDSTNQVKIQQVFEKDILIEKQLTKIADLQRLLDDSTSLIKSTSEFTEKMKKQFQELDERNQAIVQQIQKEKEEILELWENRESLSKDLREIERLNQLVIKLTNEIKQLKPQANNMKNNNPIQQGLIFESQLRTSQDFPLTQKPMYVESNSNNVNGLSNQLNFNKSDILPYETKKFSDNEQQKQNLNKSIQFTQKEFKRDQSNRPRTKTSINLDSSTINSNKNN